MIIRADAKIRNIAAINNNFFCRSNCLLVGFSSIPHPSSSFPWIISLSQGTNLRNTVSVSRLQSLTQHLKTLHVRPLAILDSQFINSWSDHGGSLFQQ